MIHSDAAIARVAIDAAFAILGAGAFYAYAATAALHWRRHAVAIALVVAAHYAPRLLAPRLYVAPAPRPEAPVIFDCTPMAPTAQPEPRGVDL